MKNKFMLMIINLVVIKKNNLIIMYLIINYFKEKYTNLNSNFKKLMNNLIYVILKIN